MSQLNIELDAKNKRIEETENTNKELDGLLKESALKLQAIETEKADLEEKLKHTEAERDKAEKKRHSEKTAGEEHAKAVKADLEALKAVLQDKEKAEEELRENISRLESEIEARDKKIQADTKYCEGVVSEVNDLRQKIKAYRLKIK